MRSSRVRTRIEVTANLAEELDNTEESIAEVREVVDLRPTESQTATFWGAAPRTLAASGSETIDVAGFVGNELGLGPARDNVGSPAGFSAIRSLYVKNTGTEPIRIFGSGGSAFNGPVNGSDTAKLNLGAGGIYVHSGGANSWPVTTGTDQDILIEATGGAASYSLYFEGEEA